MFGFSDKPHIQERKLVCFSLLFVCSFLSFCFPSFSIVLFGRARKETPNTSITYLSISLSPYIEICVYTIVSGSHSLSLTHTKRERERKRQRQRQADTDPHAHICQSRFFKKKRKNGNQKYGKKKMQRKALSDHSRGLKSNTYKRLAQLVQHLRAQTQI